MIKDFNDILKLSEKYNIPSEDVLFVAFSIYGVDVDVPYARVRYEFEPDNNCLFELSHKRKIGRYFEALPVQKGKSPFRIDHEKGMMYFNDGFLGHVYEFGNDTCDAEYTRNNGHVLNLNPISKSTCHGCKFCHTIVQDAKDQVDTKSEKGLTCFLESWVKNSNLKDLSHFEQVAVVTGTFGDAESVVSYCKLLRKIFKKYKFEGEIFYFGSEVKDDTLVEFSKHVDPFALCYTLECFENRDKLLKGVKAQQSIEDIQKILGFAKDHGITTNFSYILGIDRLEILEKKFTEMLPYINRFPIINVFQPHMNIETKGVMCDEAYNIEYYFEGRQIIEKVFKNTKMRPRTWENYRSPWYLAFADEELNGNRLP